MENSRNITPEGTRALSNALTELEQSNSVQEPECEGPQSISNKNGDESPKTGTRVKRFIPEHKKPDAAVTFPEKLMSLMEAADEHKNDSAYCAAWLADGKSFVIRNPDEFTRKLLPKYFKATKFSSFTRKLYRWGFRQVNRGIGPDDPIIFGNEYFQRDNQELMVKMRSITAASSRKQEQTTVQFLAQKRALDTMEMERDHKRAALLDQIMQNKMAFNNMSNIGCGALFNNNGMQAMNLTSALRPNLQTFKNASNMGGVKPFDFMGNNFQQSNPLMNTFAQGMGALGNFNNFGNMSGNMTGSNNMNGFSNNNNNAASSTADIVNAAINALRYA